MTDFMEWLYNNGIEDYIKNSGPMTEKRVRFPYLKGSTPKHRKRIWKIYFLSTLFTASAWGCGLA